MPTFAKSQKVGLLYLIRLHPSTRFKVGFSEDQATLEDRVRRATTWVPETVVVKAWPAQQRWEGLVRYVMSSSVEVGRAVAQFHYADQSRVAGGEVIDHADESVLIEWAETLFAHFLSMEDEE